VLVNGDHLVSVVIPAYNAEETLDETLRSVCAQTHANLEIIVVDDGSTDATLALAQCHAATDPRIQVLHQPNGGVAAARNAGWQRARSAFIAFIDADDLWAPTKIERQLRALQAAGPRAGLAYAWTVQIDTNGVAGRSYGGVHHEGDVLSIILRTNFICCGSNVLVRREALIDAQGFSSRLRAAGFEGCEDWLLTCRIAETYLFVSVPEFLVGYRDRPNSMSSHHQRMLCSHMLACRQFAARRPDQAGAAMDGLRNYCIWLVQEAMCRRERRQAWFLLWVMWRKYPIGALRVLHHLLWNPARVVRNRFRRSKGSIGIDPVFPPGRSFLELTRV
jgi:glycosyltransferase involved in cell wall biosynthesis